MESSFASRVKLFRAEKQLSQAAFAERCGLTQGNITHMEGGKEPLQSNVGKLIAGFPDLNPDWLLLGTGPMLRDGRTLTPAPVAEPKPRYTTAADTVEEASALVRLAATEAENNQLKERLDDAKAEIAWLRGKSTPSSYAAAKEQPRMEIRRWGDVAAQLPKAEGKQLFLHPEPSDAELAA